MYTNYTRLNESMKLRVNKLLLKVDELARLPPNQVNMNEKEKLKRLIFQIIAHGKLGNRSAVPRSYENKFLNEVRASNNQRTQFKSMNKKQKIRIKNLVNIYNNKKNAFGRALAQSLRRGQGPDPDLNIFD